jgi:hypothetical protein
VTTSTDRLGASLTETTRFVTGAWRPNGTFSPLAPGERQSSEDITGLVGYRPIAPLEVSVEAAVGHQMFTSPDFDTSRTAFGDTTLRARWDALDEPMPFEKTVLPWPAVTLLLALRIPTSPSGRDGSGNPFSGTTGSVGASASSEGLGAWEPSLGAAFVRSFGDLFQASAYIEAAYRFPDTYLGIERHLGPRVFGQLGARYAPSPATGIGVLTDLGWEGDVAYSGSTQPNTSQRIWTVSAFGYLRAEPSSLRWGALLRYTPPVDGIGMNASQSTSFSVSLGYVFL